MGMLGLKIKDDLEKRFREQVFESKGMKKGNISLALEEAIELWIQEQTKKGKTKNEPKQHKQETTKHE
jgi:hypothetical protein